MRKILGILIVIFIATGLIFYGEKYISYSNMKKSFIEPYTIVEKLIQEAMRDEDISKFTINKLEWNSISNDSVFQQNREPIDWLAFKEFVQRCKPPKYSLLYPSGKATSEVMEQYYKDNHRSISVECIEYDSNGGVIGVTQIKLLLQRVKGTWKVLGSFGTT